MDGITRYTQNRVQKTLWQQADDDGCFHVDGVVELFFENDDVMAVAQRSVIGTRYIPEDEPNFLRGWSLCVVDHEDEDPEPQAGVKVLLVARVQDGVSRDFFKETLKTANEIHGAPASMSFNWTAHTAKRERLWSEPSYPSALVALWFENVAQAHMAFDSEGAFPNVLRKLSQRSAAYLIDPLVKR